MYKSLYFKKQVFTMLTIDAQLSRLKRCGTFMGKFRSHIMLLRNMTLWIPGWCHYFKPHIIYSCSLVTYQIDVHNMVLGLSMHI